MSQFTAVQVVDFLKLSPKFNNELKQLAIKPEDLDASVVESLSDSLAKLHKEHVIAHGPLGLHLARWATANVASLLSAVKAPVVEEKKEEVVVEAPVVVDEPVVETPVVEAVVVEEPKVEAPVTPKKPRAKK